MSSTEVLASEAVSWLTVWSGSRVMTLDGNPAVARKLVSDGHTVFAMASDEDTVRRLGSADGVMPIWARPEAIPTDPCQFDVVLVHQAFHTMEAESALAQIARALRPGGCFSASYIIRDDSVPWVRRFAALLRHYDPMAMRGDYGQASLQRLGGSKYFPEVEQRAFRVWQPVSLLDLQRLVAQQPLHSKLDPEQRARLANEVQDLFEASVRPGERLRLPFQLLCHRAWVSHDELTAPVRVPDDGIKIRM